MSFQFALILCFSIHALETLQRSGHYNVPILFVYYYKYFNLYVDTVGQSHDHVTLPRVCLNKVTFFQHGMSTGFIQGFAFNPNR
jgi:hypothetical protein